MSNKIGIVMGGYLDENGKLMDREELNRRIADLQKPLKYESFSDWIDKAGVDYWELEQAFNAARETTTKPVTQTNDKH